MPSLGVVRWCAITRALATRAVLEPATLTRDDCYSLALRALLLYLANVLIHAYFLSKRTPYVLERGKHPWLVLGRTIYGLPVAIMQAMWIAMWIIFWEILRAPMWKPSKAHHGDVGKHRKRTPIVHDGHAAVCLCGGGFRTWYHIGVYHGLYSTFGRETLDKVHWSGSSVGSLMACIAASGVDPDVVWAHIPDIACLHRDRWWTNFSTVGNKCRFLLQDVLPEDAHVRCTGRCFISITSLFPVPHNVIVTEFETRDDLIDAVIASTYIPLWTHPGICVHHGMVCVDGGVMNNLPSLSESALRIGLDPEDATNWGATLLPSAPAPRLHTFVPASNEGLEEMYTCGKKDIANWLKTSSGKQFQAKLLA